MLTKYVYYYLKKVITILIFFQKNMLTIETNSTSPRLTFRKINQKLTTITYPVNIKNL